MPHKKIRIGLIYGGKSGEHEVSVKSAEAVLANLDAAKYEVTMVRIGKDGVWSAGPLSGSRKRTARTLPRDTVLMPKVAGKIPGIDVAFPLVHGSFGEDGSLQGLLEMAGLPYVGSGVLGSAVGMDKIVQKNLLAAAGFPTAKFVPFTAAQWRTNERRIVRDAERLRYPMFVKPSRSGSSVGISKAHHRRELMAGVAEALRYDHRILIEEAIPDAREIECGVIGGETPRASVLGEVIPSNEFYDYHAKYVSGESQIVIPAAIPYRTSETVRTMAANVFSALDAYGMARVDFFLSPHRRTPIVNEINTIPGFTVHSMFAKLWQASGLPFNQLLDELIALALARAVTDAGLERSYAAPRAKNL